MQFLCVDTTCEYNWFTYLVGTDHGIGTDHIAGTDHGGNRPWWGQTMVGTGHGGDRWVLRGRWYGGIMRVRMLLQWSGSEGGDVMLSRMERGVVLLRFRTVLLLVFRWAVRGPLLQTDDGVVFVVCDVTRSRRTEGTDQLLKRRLMVIPVKSLVLKSKLCQCFPRWLPGTGCDSWIVRWRVDLHWSRLHHPGRGWVMSDRTRCHHRQTLPKNVKSKPLWHNIFDFHQFNCLSCDTALFNFHQFNCSPGEPTLFNVHTSNSSPCETTQY